MNKRRKPPNKVTHRVDGTTTIILERRDGSAYECFIDTADYNKVKNYRWYAQKSGYTFYAATNIPTDGKQTPLKMHVLLTGALGFDHADRNGLNNRRDNLRKANYSQQGANQKIPKNNTTGERGVSWHKRDKQYAAAITINYKRKHLGYFTDLKEAAAVAKAARAAAFGEFAA